MSIMDFPYARLIMGYVPQIVLAHDALDMHGNPLGTTTTTTTTTTTAATTTANNDTTKV